MPRKRTQQPLILTQPQEPTPLALIEEAEALLLTAHERLSQAVKLMGEDNTLLAAPTRTALADLNCARGRLFYLKKSLSQQG